MKMKLLIGSACLAALTMPLAAQAQGVPGGAAHGFNEGNRSADDSADWASDAVAFIKAMSRRLRERLEPVRRAA